MVMIVNKDEILSGNCRRAKVIADGAPHETHTPST